MGNINNLVGYVDSNVIRGTYPGSVAVPIRELLYQDGNYNVQPITSLVTSGNSTTDMANFSAAFIGVSHERKVSTDVAGTIDVDRTAVFQAQCPALAAAVPVGSLVSAVPGVSTALQSQMVQPNSSANQAIGYVIEAAPAGQTFLKVMFFSNVVPAVLSGSSTQAIYNQHKLFLQDLQF